MKFIQEVTPRGVQLPATAARLAGFEAGDKVEYHNLKGALVVLKRQMTAPELLAAAQQLSDMASGLLNHLFEVCGPCDDCEKDDCPLADLEDAGVTLPDYLRQEAGIPEGAKLCAEVDPKNNAVLISMAGYNHDLRDLPPETLDMFLAANVCLGELEEHLILEDIVYGREAAV